MRDALVLALVRRRKFCRHHPDLCNDEPSTGDGDCPDCESDPPSSTPPVIVPPPSPLPATPTHTSTATPRPATHTPTQPAQSSIPPSARLTHPTTSFMLQLAHQDADFGFPRVDVRIFNFIKYPSSERWRFPARRGFCERFLDSSRAAKFHTDRPAESTQS
ncbi:hypothetical protein EXIGLDRAFT_335887 [Exidia glandulosa HHB12029]|uniref:Uncharacterized protein n=1 Tax=Exidia glandulosa HHB12029 TaxID=1314781 RepID=A0A165CM86_EXIGL|nr:hypothetical protein EXIGLDRAFT_335887 [Exidia glandulosa HHB12029]